MPSIFDWIIQALSHFFASLDQTFLKLTQPARDSIILSATADLPRTKIDLIVENALLRQQLIILHLAENPIRALSNQLR